MRRLTLALCMTLTMGVASADNSNTGYNTGYAGAGAPLALAGAGILIAMATGTGPKVAEANTFYPSTQALIPLPFSGVRCELHSEMINGQIVQGQLCLKR